LPKVTHLVNTGLYLLKWEVLYSGLGGGRNNAVSLAPWM
jgi:hypothetical protein